MAKFEAVIITGLRERVSKNVSDLLRRRELSYRTAAELCGVSSSTIFKLANNQQSISIEIAAAICNGFRITLNQLVR